MKIVFALVVSYAFFAIVVIADNYHNYRALPPSLLLDSLLFGLPILIAA